jgi:asparagine synthase (glutamine-hydrolysing)
MGGNPNPSGLLADLIVQFKFVSLAKELLAWSLIKRRPWIQLLGQAATHLLPASLAQHFDKQAKIEPWIQKDFAKRTRIAIRLLDVDEHFGLLLPTRRSCIGVVQLMSKKLAKRSLPALALEEPRYPYLDQNLIEFILSIPASQSLRAGERRSLMRRSLVGIVPDEILSRRTKQLGTRTPIIALKRNLKELQAAFTSPISGQLGYVDSVVLLQQFNAAMNGQMIHIVHLYRTVSLELWLRDLALRGLIDVAPSSFKGLARVSLEASA